LSSFLRGIIISSSSIAHPEQACHATTSHADAISGSGATATASTATVTTSTAAATPAATTATSRHNDRRAHLLHHAAQARNVGTQRAARRQAQALARAAARARRGAGEEHAVGLGQHELVRDARGAQPCQQLAVRVLGAVRGVDDHKGAPESN
jgi:hypothetical protein